jgi:hypothetical protein
MASFLVIHPMLGPQRRPDMRPIPNTEINTMCPTKSRMEIQETRENAGRKVEVPGVCSRLFP